MKKMGLIAALAMTAAVAVPAVISGPRQQEATPQAAKHPLDAWLEECTSKDESTAGQITCLGTAYGKWDAELNRVYQELMKKLPDDARPALKAAQVAWLVHRDEEFELLDALYGAMDGTMYELMRAADRVDFVRKRALELSSYISVLDSK